MQGNYAVHTAGYILCDLGQGKYFMAAANGGPTIHGDFKDVVIKSVKNLGFAIEEIEFAVLEMLRKGHDSAHFGMYKTFIYSFDRETKSGSRKAS